MKIIPPQGAFTVAHNGIAREIHYPTFLLPASTQGTPRKFDGLWDTGATNTVINKLVVDELKLKPIGVTEVYTAQGKHLANTFLVEMFFPESKLQFRGVRVTLGELKNCDVLIGMDIISCGDFAVTNKKGITTMSFRVPSMRTIDFVKQINQEKRGHYAKPKRRRKRKR